MKPQLVVSLLSPQAMDMLQWLFDNCADDEWKGVAFYWRDPQYPGLYSQLTMSDSLAVMFKLSFPEALAVDSIDPDCFNFKKFFIDNRKYQRTGLENVDFWAIPVR